MHQALQRWTRPCWRTAPIGWFGEADIKKHVDLCNSPIGGPLKSTTRVYDTSAIQTLD